MTSFLLDGPVFSRRRLSRSESLTGIKNNASHVSIFSTGSNKENDDGDKTVSSPEKYKEKEKRKSAKLQKRPGSREFGFMFSPAYEKASNLAAADRKVGKGGSGDGVDAAVKKKERLIDSNEAGKGGQVNPETNSRCVSRPPRSNAAFYSTHSAGINRPPYHQRVFLPAAVTLPQRRPPASAVSHTVQEPPQPPRLRAASFSEYENSLLASLSSAKPGWTMAAVDAAFSAPAASPASICHGPPYRSVSAAPGWDLSNARTQPRRATNSSTASAASSIAGQTSDWRARCLSYDSHTSSSLEGIPPFINSHTSATAKAAFPWSQYRLQNSGRAIRSYRQKARPGELFEKVPTEVLELILERLRQLHLAPGSSSCATCYMRDCCNVALTARKFLKPARQALYADIELVGADNPAMRKRLKVPWGARLTLLRRTLRNNGNIAIMVKSLKVPKLPPGAALADYHDMVASVVMAAPYLERLMGYYPTHNHSFSRLHHALSTRQRLKEMNWIVEPSPVQRQRRKQDALAANQHHLSASGDLQPSQSASFIELHTNWQQLATLVIHCRPGAALTPDTLLGNTLRYLPALHNLYLSYLPQTSFSDSSLMALPPLTTLSLTCLSGVTMAGLSAFATRQAASCLETLTLVQMDINSVPVLARILANLGALKTLRIGQARAPAMPSDEPIWLFPYLASASLSKMHWDVRPDPATASTGHWESSASAADQILAKSIAANGFPALTALCTPHDPQGIFQMLCRPRERIDTPADRYRSGGPIGGSAGMAAVVGQTSIAGTLSPPLVGTGNGRRRGRRDSLASAGSSGFHATSGPFGLHDSRIHSNQSLSSHSLAEPPPRSDLCQSRLTAQTRLEAARRFPRYFVHVVDENGVVEKKHGVGAFMGTADSPIRYVLVPEPNGGTDTGGGLVAVADMVGDCGEDLVVPANEVAHRDLFTLGLPLEDWNKGGVKKDRDSGKKSKDKDRTGLEEEMKTREGCCGRWNAAGRGGTAADKKDRERWWHVERGRWRGVVLS